MLRLGILLSGRGSNFLAIADRVRSGELPAEIVMVISNRTDAAGIEAARKRGLKAVVIESRGRSREAHEREVISALREADVELICLAGYMRLLSPEFVREFPDRILNIHPSLLPAFPGMDAQQQALDYGVKITGCTVHFVDEHLDHGPIVVQRAVEVREDDTLASLSARILAAEHVAYSDAIAKVARGECEIDGRCVRVRSQPTRG
jgi:phosphoribosylglycinamide formyltransferase 1